MLELSYHIPVILLGFAAHFPTGNRSDYILLRRIYLSIGRFSRARSVIYSDIESSYPKHEAYSELLTIAY